MSYLKPQTPLQHKDGDYFYPLTTIDQIIMEDGVTRLNGADLVSVNTDGAPEGETAGINADTLGGYAADAYIRQDSSKALLSIDLNEIVNGTASPTNADMLGNVPAEKVFSDLDGKLSMELLWENASPTSEFAEQTINVDMSGYPYCFIRAYRSNANYRAVPMVMFKPGERFDLIYNATATLYHRSDNQTTTTSITFAAAYGDSKVNNCFLIPSQLFGIKGVSA